MSQEMSDYIYEQNVITAATELLSGKHMSAGRRVLTQFLNPDNIMQHLAHLPPHARDIYRNDLEQGISYARKELQ